MRQALEKMRHHSYTAAPLVNEEGRYAGTVTEGDLLWQLVEYKDQGFEEAMNSRLKDISLRVKNVPIFIHAQMEDLIALSADQNFIPVTDDSEYFIGIVRRRDIIKHCSSLLFDKSET